MCHHASRICRGKNAKHGGSDKDAVSFNNFRDIFQYNLKVGLEKVSIDIC